MKRLLVTLFLLFNIGYSAEVRIGSEVDITGVRTNFLTGYGIVVGLNGTGDGTTSIFTLISIANMLRKMGIYIDPARVRTKNAAAVIVTAKMPPLAKSGMKFDVTVASIGDSKSIGNGVLIRTPLFGPDGKVYAFAQGSVSTGGGFSESNKGGKVQKNFPTTGIIVNGGIIERDLPYSMNGQKEIQLILKKPNFDKAFKIEKAINEFFKQQVAHSIDPTTVKVKIPEGQDPVEFISKVLALKIETDQEPTVVIYERTGTVIMSGDIKIKGRIFGIQSPSLKDLVKALNDLGVSPRDLIAIIQAIKNAGKLHAKVIVM